MVPTFVVYAPDTGTAGTECRTFYVFALIDGTQDTALIAQTRATDAAARKEAIAAYFRSLR